MPSTPHRWGLISLTRASSLRAAEHEHARGKDGTTEGSLRSDYQRNITCSRVPCTAVQEVSDVTDIPKPDHVQYYTTVYRRRLSCRSRLPLSPPPIPPIFPAPLLFFAPTPILSPAESLRPFFFFTSIYVLLLTLTAARPPPHLHEENMF